MFEIRQATSADVDAIGRLNQFVHALHVEAHPHIFKPVEPDSLTPFLTKQIAQVNNYFYVAESAEGIIGYIWAEVQRRNENPLMYGWSRIYIHHISVDPTVRTGGVGTALMNAAEELAQKLNIDQIALDAWSFNGRAQQFFTNRGFEIYNVRRWKQLE